MQPLERIIRETIESDGPMNIERYMGFCLAHPVHGYYMSRHPFGEEGDFITAPEVSQVFGELIGIWCASVWDQMGKPHAFNLVELGPGRGTLMADILRATKIVPGFLETSRVHLIETSPRLREAQKAAIRADVTWHEAVSMLPDGPTLLVANEFFDAIPIRQFERRDGRWFERVVGMVGERLEIGLVEVAERLAPAPDGAIIERAPQRSAIAEEIGERLARHGGAALIIDYGHLASSPGDTLQAVRKHKHVPVTDEPGLSDLTSHVDFETLGGALGQGGAKVWPPLTQRAFLLAMGLEQRFAALSANADAETRDVLHRAQTRLADEAQMGNLFKVLVAAAPGLPVLYPFGGT